MNDSEKIRIFAERIAIPLSNTDNVKWPIRSGLVISFVNDVYANEFISDLKTLVDTISSEYWSTAFYNSLSIWKISHHIINGLRKLDISNKKIAENILLMCNVLDVITQKKWVELNTHTVLLQKEIKKITYECISEYSKETNSLLAIASAGLWAYSDALFFQGREICCERHGLYLTDTNKKIYITDVNGIDEAASCIWPSTYKRMNLKSIRIVLAFDQMFEMTIDPYNNTDLIEGSFIESCCGGALIIDGTVMSEHDIASFLNEIMDRIYQQTKIVNSLSIEELSRLYIDIFWYRKKRLSEIVGNTWTPDPIVYQLINTNSTELKKQDNSKKVSYEALVNKYDYSNYLD